MPRSEAPRPTARRMASSIRCSRSHCIAAMKLPTPGNTILSALAIACGSRVTRRSAPTCRSARPMLATFATGESIKVTSISRVCGLRSATACRRLPRRWQASALQRLDHSFRARHASADDLLCLAQRQRERFENCLGGVMPIASANQIDVNVARAFVRERFEEFLDQREWKIFVNEKHLAVERDLEHEVRP